MPYIAIKGFPKDDEALHEVTWYRDKILILSGKRMNSARPANISSLQKTQPTQVWRTPQ